LDNNKGDDGEYLEAPGGVQIHKKSHPKGKDLMGKGRRG
jgi:hypothetical protein